MTKAKRAPRFSPIPKLDTTPEGLARAMFAAVPPPDPSKRKARTSRTQSVPATRKRT